MGRRWVKVLLIVFVILAGLFVAVDRIAVHYAEKEAVALAQEKYGYSNSTNSSVDLSIHGFPFLTQAASLEFDHVTLTAGDFSVNTTTNAQGDHLTIRRLELDLHDLSAGSISSRRVDANLVTGRVTIGYDALSGVLSRLTDQGGALTVKQDPTASSGGNTATEAPLRVTGTKDGRTTETAASISVAADEFELRVPQLAPQPYTWRIPLPQNINITAVRSTADGVEFELTGHQVVLGG
ncbi:DUF2993 domain-containing protein [Streptomyces sp. SKN60]|uniref:LmeA family phospholipid-binding protein n=1 Tax=Streptomyces sp. SKN60 TaxID=2855506 RepID=UPI002247E74E|nr:DUF2993 domain-containing protein [Streptomyces sp. SKN60]